MSLLLPFLLLCSGPLLASPEHRNVDVIEVSHVYVRGEVAFTQILFWEEYRSPVAGKRSVRVVAWAMFEPDRNLWQKVPYKVGNLWHYDHFSDRMGSNYPSDYPKKHFKVTAKLFRESWSEVDPEVEDRKMHPYMRQNSLFAEETNRKVEE